jgi:TPR repeat protein
MGKTKSWSSGKGKAHDAAEGHFNLGLCLEHGWGVAVNAVEAVKCYRQAADAGNAYGQNRLAMCYAHGLGVEKDEAESKRWYHLAAAQGVSWKFHEDSS